MNALLQALLDAYAKIHSIHWFACGYQFDVVHKFTKKYYQHLQDDYDECIERMLQNDEIPSAQPSTFSYEKDYDYIDAIMGTAYALVPVMDALKLILSQTGIDEGTRNWIASLSDYWNKEADYFLTRRFESIRAIQGAIEE